MLIWRSVLEGIATGDIDLLFRRQRRPTVKAGGSLRTEIGVLAIEAVDPVAESAITDEDIKRAGFGSREALLDSLRLEGQLYRVRVRYQGADPRIALRNDAALTDEDVEALQQRLDRFDRASRYGPWTAATLRLIADHPATRAPDLAARVGRETAPFKIDVRKLKELGLTESLPIGYQLSPRGRAFLERRKPR